MVFLLGDEGAFYSGPRIHRIAGGRYPHRRIRKKSAMTRGGLAALFTLGGAAILLLATNGEGATLIVPNTVIAWRDLANKYAQIYGILDPEEILAVIWNESTGNPNGSNPGDPSWGLMGVEPLIARAYGGF